MSWLVYIMIVLGITQEFLCQMYSFKYYTLEKYVLYLLSLFLIIILFSFQVPSDCSAKNKYHVKRLLYINESILFSYSKTIRCDPLPA